jgi:IS30 family transposase
MIVRTRTLTSEDHKKLWQLFKEGRSPSQIARALGKKQGTVSACLIKHGGFAPVPKRRRVSALSIEDREEISRGLYRDESLRCIAARLDRHPSTIYREVKRNGGRHSYRAADADAQVEKRARRPKLCKLARHRRLQRVVTFKLSQNWSPEQIAGWLKLRFPTSEEMRISHETIYRSLFVQARGVLKKELKQHLRTRRGMRRSKHGRSPDVRQGIIDAVSIRERPPEVEDRAVPGHWEGDLIAGSQYSYIATLVERQSRYVMLVKLESKEADVVVDALKKQITKLPVEVWRSLTWDRAMEMAQHKAFTVATDVDVYFADPASPWQRGTNENTNGLLRQYFPDGTDLRQFSQASLNKVARQLNERPRKTLGFQTPADTLNVALTP